MPRKIRIGEMILGRYEVTEYLPGGGQAILMKGIDKQTGDVVAIKQLAASPGGSSYDEELARFRRAAQIRIEHPNDVDPIDYGEEAGDHFMIMPFIEGSDLEDYLNQQGGRLSFDEAVSIACELALALKAAHDKGYVHRDIKPQNIRIALDGSVHLLDFGICRILTEKTITSGTGILGTLPYMSPEQLDPNQSEDHGADLYSVGVVLYRMLTGSLPVQGDTVSSVVGSICCQTPPPPRQLDPSIPEHVDRACMRLLAKHRDTRFQSAEEFLQAIQGTAPKTGSCPSCSAQSYPNAGYCHSCGAELNGGRALLLCLACGTTIGQEPDCPGCGRPFGHSDHRLHFMRGSLTGRVYRIPEGIYCIGRDQLNQRDQEISRHHCYVTCTDGMVVIQDAGSTNHTFVGNEFAGGPIILAPNLQLHIARNVATYTHQ